MKGMAFWGAAFAAALAVSPANAECVGDDEYTVCTDADTDDNGDVHASSWDTEGNTYRIDTESHAIGNGHVTTSSDSEGNEYSIRTWSDSGGSHSEDSEGNVCTITPTGQMIGCGE